MRAKFRQVACRFSAALKSLYLLLNSANPKVYRFRLPLEYSIVWVFKYFGKLFIWDCVVIFMRWYLVVSLFSDGRIRFLFGFVIVAIIVAIILIFIEVSLKKKKIRIEKMARESTPVDKLRKFLKGDKTAKEKLDFIDKTAKEYFARIYGTHGRDSYSILIAKFEKDNEEEEIGFCKAMFASYYSNEELINGRVRMLGDLLLDIINKKKRVDVVSKSPSVFEKVGGFFNKYREVVKQRGRERINFKRVKKMKKIAAIKKKGLLKISKKKERVIALRKKRKNKLDRIAARRKRALILMKAHGERNLLKKKKKELIKKRRYDAKKEGLIAKKGALVMREEKKQGLVARTKVFGDKFVRKKDENDSTSEGGVASRIVNRAKELSW